MSLLDSYITSITLAVTIAYAVTRLSKVVLERLNSPLRLLPGPPNPSILFGHLKLYQGADVDVTTLHEAWVEQYGNTYVTQAPFGINQLQTLDVKAVAHFLNRDDIYHKPPRARKFIENLLGKGLLTAEDQEHKNQRRVMNPAFGPTQLRNLTGIFLSKAYELRDKWANDTETKSDQPITVEVLSWLNKTTLDIIGLAGFSYRFDALSSNPDSPNELYAAFDLIFRPPVKIDAWLILVNVMPFLRVVPTPRQREFDRARSVMDRVSRRLITEKKAGAFNQSEFMAKSSAYNRDLMSLLIRANLAQDLPDSQRMSDECVIAQIFTFMAAGHETTSTTASWALHLLSIHGSVQDRLRCELQALHIPKTAREDEPLSAEELSALNASPLLDAVIRETLRMYPPGSGLARVATKDDVIPLAKPVKDKNGEWHQSIPIRKGELVLIPVIILNRLKELWGEDAHIFRPDRWLGGLSAGAMSVPGIWANILSFSGGTHACIGYRFALIELKILLYSLVTTFKFKPAVTDIVRKAGLLERPFVQSELDQGSQLPLVVERILDPEA